MSPTNPVGKKDRLGSIVACVSDAGGSEGPLQGAWVSVYKYESSAASKFDAKAWQPEAESRVDTRPTNNEGCVTFSDLKPATYVAVYEHYPKTQAQQVRVEAGCISDVCFRIPLNARATVVFLGPDCKPIPCKLPRVNDVANIEVTFADFVREHVHIDTPGGVTRVPGEENLYQSQIDSPGHQRWAFGVQLGLVGSPVGVPPDAMAMLPLVAEAEAVERSAQRIDGTLGVTLQRTGTAPTADVPLWVLIRNSTEALSFNSYLNFMNNLFCGGADLVSSELERTRRDRKRANFADLKSRRFLPFTDSDAYRVVKAATEAFVMVNCGVLMSDALPFDPGKDDKYLALRDIPAPPKGLKKFLKEDYLVKVNGGTSDETLTLPYLAVIRAKLPDVPIKLTAFENAVPGRAADECFGFLQEKLANPCLIELIWSYWQEEGGLVQSVNAVTRRFQNVRAPFDRDPLANLEIDPLRPLNNLLWGYIQDEQHRLTVVRRNYEYDHHYGLRLEGKAVQDMRAADTRSQFLEAFHNLLRLCSAFFKQDDDTTVKADAFPVLNALKEVHLILSQGAHNQYGDLPSTARIEMLMQQWLLARPEFREFLPTRIMVAYPEPWMDRVDAMKKIQGWTDTSVLHFRNLALFGEQLLLSIRWGYWTDVQDPVQALNWARFFRPQAQGFIHAYRAVTGVDLAAESIDSRVDATLPSVLMRQRLTTMQRGA
jgi:hypothetical protein